ncbi:MAG: hypothetical protein LBO09_04170 [Candidatus Peribacteria bacterium]|nr:hypothetical protein [Candidatus Peribacteria bacterium]
MQGLAGMLMEHATNVKKKFLIMNQETLTLREFRNPYYKTFISLYYTLTMNKTQLLHTCHKLLHDMEQELKEQDL